MNGHPFLSPEQGYEGIERALKHIPRESQYRDNEALCPRAFGCLGGLGCSH
ncbi:hypothetical protein ACHAWF_000689 [Thalassiosira exigua]